jgi:DNA mismatch repair protein MutS2
MDRRALTTLEFGKVRDQVAAYTLFSVSKQLADDAEPSSSRYVVQAALSETTEARRLLALVPDFLVRGAHDIRATARSANMGAVADPEALLKVAAVLEGVTYVRTTVLRVAHEVPSLSARAQTLDPCPGIVRAIRHCLSDEGDVLDRASPELARARTHVRSAHTRLMETLRRIVDSAVESGHAQEAIVTMRAGRYVIPIRAHSRNVFRGIVHDESGSGATVFMEPIAVVALNNDWRQAQIAEAKEVERVLAMLSGMVGNAADPLVADVNALAAIDYAIARARYASQIDGVEPTVLPDPAPDQPGRFDFIGARHPLLRGEVVPIDVCLGDTATSANDRDGARDGGTTPDQPVVALLITGPNTGGKTVALKTAGLLHLMAQVGYHVPTERGACFTLVENVYADIGDEQSIEQSLSTFSSHLSNIVRIQRAATARDLVLLDELGAGTDPQEGAALARAIVSDLVTRRIPLIATTHYSELKAYAYETPGVRNASVEFDVATLRPTYRLRIGVPGRSNALAIAERLGLDPGIIATARALVNPDERRVEDLLAGIDAERAQASAARQAAESKHAEARVRLAHIEQRIAFIEEERAELLARARADAAQLLEDARVRVLRAEATVGAPAGTTRALAQQAARQLQTAAREMRSADDVGALGRVARASGAANETLAVGDRVEVKRLNSAGTITKPPDVAGQVEVQLGTMRLRIHLRDLTPISQREVARRDSSETEGVTIAEARPRPTVTRAVRSPAQVGLEIDVRGERADDACERVDRYLNDAYLGSLPWVRVIHGKGTGALRQAIRDMLGASPMVQRFESAGPRDGGDGATIVHLAV